MARLNNHRDARARMTTKPDAGRGARPPPKPKRRERSKPHPQISAILKRSQPSPTKPIAQRTISDHISKDRAEKRHREDVRAPHSLRSSLESSGWAVSSALVLTDRKIDRRSALIGSET